MIYFIDEDLNELPSIRQELEMRGYETKQLLDADEGFKVLMHADDLELAIIDVMLSTGETGSSRYPRDITDNFLITGLVLTKELHQQQNHAAQKLFPNRIILYSHATEQGLVDKINKTSKSLGITYLSKNDYDNSYIFANKIEEIINGQ